MRRAFLIACDTALIATGMSFGPIAINATMPIKAISDQAKSNIVPPWRSRSTVALLHKAGPDKARRAVLGLRQLRPGRQVG